MRDADDTCIAVCSMENVDPLGVHTGDSIVVAPVQTLPDQVHQRLRSAALAIIRALGVEGGCNVQFALSPDSTEYAVIEVNPRVSRSSRARLEGDGLPDRARRGADRDRAAARRDPERDHRARRSRRSSRRSTTWWSSCRASRSTSSRRRRPQPRQPDEGDRRGDGDRPDLRRGAEQGAPRARAGRRRARSPRTRRGAPTLDYLAAVLGGDPEDDAPIRWLDERGDGVRIDAVRAALGGADRAAAVPRAVRLAPVAGARAAAARRPGGRRSSVATGISPWFLAEMARNVALEGEIRETGARLVGRGRRAPDAEAASLLATAKRFGFGDGDIANLASVPVERRPRGAPPRSASRRATRWSTRAPRSSPRRRRTSTRPTRPRARRPRRRPSRGPPRS